MTTILSTNMTVIFCPRKITTVIFGPIFSRTDTLHNNRHRGRKIVGIRGLKCYQ